MNIKKMTRDQLIEYIELNNIERLSKKNEDLQKMLDISNKGVKQKDEEIQRIKQNESTLKQVIKNTETQKEELLKSLEKEANKLIKNLDSEKQAAFDENKSLKKIVFENVSLIKVIQESQNKIVDIYVNSIVEEE